MIFFFFFFTFKNPWGEKRKEGKKNWEGETLNGSKVIRKIKMGMNTGFFYLFFYKIKREG